jgi:hypothetical protein
MARSLATAHRGSRKKLERPFALIPAKGKNPRPMPAPARRRSAAERAVRPPSPVERALVRERARRRAQIEHQRERKHARRRFVVLVVFLLFVTTFIGLTIWDQIQALFGL